MPISEDGRKRQLEALARARQIRKEKLEAALVPPVDEMPQVVLTPSNKAVVESPMAPPTGHGHKMIFTSMDDREMTVCLADKCWTGKTFDVTEDDCKVVGEKSGNVPSLSALVTELQTQLKTAGFIVSVK